MIEEEEKGKMGEEGDKLLGQRDIFLLSLSRSPIAFLVPFAADIHCLFAVVVPLGTTGYNPVAQ